MKKITILLILFLLVGCQMQSGDNKADNTDTNLQTVDFKSDQKLDSLSVKLENMNSNLIDENQITFIYSDEIKVEGEVSKFLNDYNFKVELVNNELVIKTDTSKTYSNLKVNLTIYGPIHAFDIEGNYVVKFDNPQSQELSMNLLGEFDLEINNIKNDKVKLQVEGAGRMELVGETKLFEANLSGLGSIEAFDLMAEEAIVHLEGAGEINTYAVNKLKASLQGLGGIHYKGNPEVEKHMEGLGSIDQAQ